MPWSMEQKIFCVKTYYETKSFQIVQGSSALTNFQTGVRFTSWSRSLKLMALVEIVG